jgi:hypothetical protein
MTWFIDHKSTRRLSAQLAAGLAISALLVLGAGVGPARADDDRGRGEHRGWGHHEGYDGHGHWNGGYYRAPPVAYYGRAPAPTYYYPPPPVVYGPGVGVTLPGLNFNFH